VLIIGLGCERNQLSGLMAQEKLDVNSRLQTFVMQESGGTRKTIEAAVEAVKKMLPKVASMSKAERTKLPGVSADRAHQMVAGAIVAEAAMDLFDIEAYDDEEEVA